MTSIRPRLRVSASPRLRVNRTPSDPLRARGGAEDAALIGDRPRFSGKTQRKSWSVPYYATACHDFPEERAVTVAMNTEFIAAGVAGDLVVARGEVIRRTGSLVFLRGQVAVGERILINCSSVVKRVKRG